MQKKSEWQEFESNWKKRRLFPILMSNIDVKKNRYLSQFIYFLQVNICLQLRQ